MSKEISITAKKFLENNVIPVEEKLQVDPDNFCYTTEEVEYHMEKYAEVKLKETLKLNQEELSFLEDALKPMIDGYIEEAKHFLDEEYYAETNMNLANDILKKITNQLYENKDE